MTSRREVTEGREGRVPGRRPVPWLNSVTWELELLWSFFEKILRGPQMVTLTGNTLLCYLFAMSIQHCLITISANRNSTGYKGDSLRSRLGLHQPKWPSNKNERYHPDIRVWSQQTKDQSNLSVKYPNTQFCSLPTVLYLYVKCSFPLSFSVLKAFSNIGDLIPALGTCQERIFPVSWGPLKFGLISSIYLQQCLVAM